MGRKNSRRFLGALALAGLMAVGNYAFTASNAVAESAAGQGATTISGYTITNVSYTLDTSGATANVSAVSFNIAPTTAGSAPANVKARLTAAGTYQSCSNTSGTTWSCSFTGVTALSAATLDVAAAQ